jgi:soluble lytic murein transglycosylase-like protein
MLVALGCADAHVSDVHAQALTGAPPSSPASQAVLREFPRRSLYLDIVKREAISRGLPAAIADAVVWIESGYDPSAVGAVGEVGLMQVRPATAAMLGFLGTNAELAEPETNIRYGVAYLAKAWRLAEGDLCRTLMKYRAGHGEETMTPLSTEYCRRAKVHLAALGWAPTDKAEASPNPTTTPVRLAGASPGEAAVPTGPKLISVRSSGALLAANRGRIAEAWNRISVMAKR